MTNSAAEYTLPLFADLPPAKPLAPVPGASQARAATRPGRESYFNTTRQVGDQLAEYRQAAASQEELIKHFFCQRPGLEFTPSQLSPVLANAPLTSVRRALSNLTSQGVLEKTIRQRPGAYGRPEHLWRLNPYYVMEDGK